MKMLWLVSNVGGFYEPFTGWEVI